MVVERHSPIPSVFLHKVKTKKVIKEDRSKALKAFKK